MTRTVAAADDRCQLIGDDGPMVFTDRIDAGQRLARLLQRFAVEQPVVVALPRGGVPIAVEVARSLHAPLEVLTVRKLGAPMDPEFAIGAIAEDGTMIVHEAIVRQVGVTSEELERIVARERHELRRRAERFGRVAAPVDIRGRTVIVVDDGFATGLSDLVAVRALRRRGAGRIVVAAPVGSREAVGMLGREADDVVCVTIPRHFLGVGRWYKDFSPVCDDEVVRLLAEMAAAPGDVAAGG